MLYKISAPGSTMLLGEHAVLYGHSAIVCAINRRITIYLEPRVDKNIHIYSKELGECITSLDSLFVQYPFHFILASIQIFQKELTNGFNLTISSEFPNNIGFGSSAAVTVATLGALQRWLTSNLNQDRIYRDALEITHRIQGLGSGADIAASTFGGILHYTYNPLKIDKLHHYPNINLIYCGYKTPTSEVIKRMLINIRQSITLYNVLFISIGKIVRLGKEAINNANWKALGNLFQLHQRLQILLGVSDNNLDEIVANCNKITSLLGAKISGSGLGDCIIALGKLPENYFPINKQQIKNGVKQFNIQISEQGIIDET